MSKYFTPYLEDKKRVMEIATHVRQNYMNESVEIMSIKQNTTIEIIVAIISRLRFKTIRDLSDFKKGIDFDYINSENYWLSKNRFAFAHEMRKHKTIVKHEQAKPIVSESDEKLRLNYAKTLGYKTVAEACKILTTFGFNMRFRSYKIAQKKSGRVVKNDIS